MLSRFIATVFCMHLPRLSWLPDAVCSPLLYLCLYLSLYVSLFLFPSLMLSLLVAHSFLSFSLLSFIPSFYSFSLHCTVFSVCLPSLSAASLNTPLSVLPPPLLHVQLFLPILSACFLPTSLMPFSECDSSHSSSQMTCNQH